MKKTQQEIKNQFDSLFTNTLNLGEYDTTGIQKIIADKDIVYSAIDLEDSTDSYELSLHVPIINIKSELSNSLNQITQATFINKANEIMQNNNTNNKTIYSIDYVAFVNYDILSVVIKSTLKEGESAQRVMVQTYNYNLSTNEELHL